MADLRERFHGLDQIEVPDLRTEIEQRATGPGPPVTLQPVVRPSTVPRGVLVAAGAAIAVLVLIGAITLLTSSEREQVEPTQTTTTLSPVDAFPFSDDFGDGGPLVMSSGFPADDGEPPLALGMVNEVPDNTRLDFLWELCDVSGSCIRIPIFTHPDGGVGVGPWLGNEPFHIRHGFVNRGAEPLGSDFDVKVFIRSPLETGPENRTNPASGHPLQLDLDVVYEFSSDYVIRGVSNRCGPTYRTQQGPEPCEWFVHNFPDGLPPGRFEFMVVWEAPCWAWLEMGATAFCADPDEVQRLFWARESSPFYDPEWDGFTQGVPSPWDYFDLYPDDPQY